MRRALSRFLICLISSVLCCSMIPVASFGLEEKSNGELSSGFTADAGLDSQEQYIQDAAQEPETKRDVFELQVEEIENKTSVIATEKDGSKSTEEQYVQPIDTGKLSLSIEYQKDNIHCGTPIEFKVVAAGGRGKYIYRLNDWSLKGEGYWPYIVDPALSKYQDSDTFSLTFYTSGTYNLSFGAMESTECGEGPYAFSSVLDGRISFTINDPNYPSKEKIADQIATECKSKNFSSDFEKALWLHDWLIDNCEYNVKYCNPEGAFVRGEGNCESYHGAFIMLLERVGIACGRITGNGHVWTAAKLDGSWCQIDVTWDDYPQLSGYPDLNHLYFGLDDRLMGFAHPDHSAPVVGYESKSLENHYYVKSGEIKKYSNQYINQIQANLNKGVMNFSIPVVENYWDASYADIIQNIVAYDLSKQVWSSSGVLCRSTVSYNNKFLSFNFTIQLKPGWNQDGLGNWIYIKPDGSPHKGWLSEGGHRYYLDPQTGVMQTGLQVIDGKKYFFRDTPYGNMLTGVQSTPEGTYCFNADGTTSSGWIKSGGYWYYFDPQNDNKAAIGWKTIGARTYYLHPDSTMAQGWNKIGDNWYYFISEGSMQKGWLNNSGGWYYLDPSSGAMSSGFRNINGNVYYLDPANDSRMASGWKKVEDKWYYFDPTNDSRMATGWKKLSGGWYYLDPDDAGAMVTGWKTVGANTYYLDPSNDSRMVTGWKEIDGNWHYFITEGTMQKCGWLNLGSNWYYLDPQTGIMQTGWLTLGNNAYYLRPAPNGSMVTGLQTIDGKCYAFAPAPSGCMIKGQWYRSSVDGYWYWPDPNDGYIVTSSFVNDGIGDSYVGSDGRMVIGWVWIGDKNYYFNSAGYMQRSKWIDGYWVGEDGVWVPNK